MYRSPRREGYVAPPPEALLAAQYAGPKAGLRPIYDRIVEAARALGDEVAVDPRRAYVSLSRERQFAVIRAATKDRVDLGLRLPGVPAGGRLQPAGAGNGGSMTHVIGLSAAEEVDAEVRAWLQVACAAAF